MLVIYGVASFLISLDSTSSNTSKSSIVTRKQQCWEQLIRSDCRSCDCEYDTIKHYEMFRDLNEEGVQTPSNSGHTSLDGHSCHLVSS